MVTLDSIKGGQHYTVNEKSLTNICFHTTHNTRLQKLFFFQLHGMFLVDLMKILGC